MVLKCVTILLSTFLELYLYSYISLLFQAKSVLRLHNIKPHWMFTLDTLVSSAVNAVIAVLKPGIYCLLWFNVLNLTSAF